MWDALSVLTTFATPLRLAPTNLTAQIDTGTALTAIQGGLIVSCQPARPGPLDSVEDVVAMAKSAEIGGAAGLRIEGIANVRAVGQATGLPIVAIIKRDLADFEVRITPELSDVDALVEAGAPIIAFDATDRPRPCAVPALIARIHESGAVAFADCATVAEGRAAHAAGAEIVASTLSGYTGPGEPPAEPDLALVRALAQDGLCVVAEGRLRQPAQAAAAMEAGAYAVVVGNAITRPDLMTKWFAEAVRAA